MGRLKNSAATTRSIAPALFPNDTPAEKKSQREIVFEILDSGILKPTEIESIAVDQYQTKVSKGNINQIKMFWKKKRGAPKTNVATTASKPAASEVSRKQPSVAPATSATAVSATSNGDVIAATLDLVKAVGVERAESILKALGR